jgi:plastocyanin
MINIEGSLLSYHIVSFNSDNVFNASSLYSHVIQYLDYSIYRNNQDQGSSEGLSSVHGTIIDVNGNALEGVKIEADGKTTHTNAQGKYYLYDLIGNQVEIRFTMEDYGDLNVWINIRSEGTNILEVELEEGGINKSIDRRNSVEICNTADINFTAVNNGNFEDTAKIRISNLQELEDAGFLLALPAEQYLIESGSEQLIKVLVDSTGVADTEIDYPLTLNVSTTLQDWDASAETTTTMKVVECQGDNEEESEENETIFPEKPTAIAGQDVSISPGDTVQFNGAGTDENGTIVKYEWDFDGDGVYEWSSEENGRTTNIYNNAGTYNPTLRITDNEGNTATDSLTVTVKSPEVEEESRLPSLSLLAVVTMLGIVSILRRK